jgi:hypothetical protein
MEKDFFNLYRCHERLALEIGHSSVACWNVTVHDRRGSMPGDYSNPIVNVTGCHREAVFAESYTSLVNYFNNNRGGY